MKKIIILFIVLVISISFSSAVKISPTQQELTINQYETNCTNIWILPETDYKISSKWTYNGEGNISKYTLTKEKIKLEINYSYLSKGKYEVCFTPNKAGNLSGIIYFYDEKNMIEIGTWIDLKVEQVGTIESISLITGNTISKINGTNIGLGLTLFLLLVILGLIVKRAFIDK